MGLSYRENRVNLPSCKVELTYLEFSLKTGCCLVEEFERWC